LTGADSGSRQWTKKESLLCFEPELGYKICFVTLTGSNIVENLLVEKFDRAVFNVGANLRKKQFDKLQKEDRDQLFEEPIVIGHNRPAYIMQECYEAR
jgi:hypothetical protein